MVIPGERIAAEEGSEDTDDTGTASIGDIGESANILSSGTSDIPPSPAHTRSYGKAKKTKDRETSNKGYGVVYLPGDISGLTKKLHSLAAEFFAGNTTVRNDLVHVLDALLILKQLTRKEYAVPHLIAHIVASTIADAAKKRKK